MMNRRLYGLLIVCVLVTTNACTTTGPRSQEPRDTPQLPTTVLQEPLTTPPPSQEAGDTPQLRISNTGPVDIQELNVVFPGSIPALSTRVNFGSVAAGATTDYQPTSSGVYRYAAYEYRLDGATVYQAVMDWMGEEPLPGTHFTYEVMLDLTRVQGDQIQLVNVRTDRR